MIDLTCRIRVYGVVQGVGFRPTVARHAATCNIRGSVCNCGPYVEIIAQGSEAEINSFLERLEKQPPKRSSILKIDVTEQDNAKHYDEFSIIESAKTRGSIYISPDIAICDDCSREIFDPGNKRYLHPFINCTCCGPRMTILDALPYDRVRTSMKKFPMCPECAAEYVDPENRRYDAQPVCCNDCGPEVYALGGEERGKDAITKARSILSAGGIVAVKGIGGFHLCCDATNESAVKLLRDRKNRPVKPLAVMMRNMDTVLRECVVLPGEQDILTGHQKPILLLEKKPDGMLAPSVAPGNPTVGVMLPYAPIQLLLFDYDDEIEMPDCLVMTSGNPSGAPICHNDQEASDELGGLSDYILSNNRDIRIRADDTVTDFYNGRQYMIRRSRGYAPLPFLISGDFDTDVLAIGGELKNSFCVAAGGLLYMSPYIGDLEDIRTVYALEESKERFLSMLEIKPDVVACDLHPAYHSVQLAKETGLPLIQVQHHYAHVLSCMAENDYSEPVIGVSFDGTGYGTDGTIWGGEFLVSDPYGFERAGSIKPFIQIGGDKSAREGWRIAVSMIYSLYHDKEKALRLIKELALCDSVNAGVQFAMADGKINAIKSTSAGRLFDAVSAILGICRVSTFEGDASTALQYRAQAHIKKCSEEADLLHDIYESVDDGSGLLLMSTDRLVLDMITGRLHGTPVDELAYEFHRQLAGQIVETVVRISADTGISTAVLTGGVYQNHLLLDMSVKGLEKRGIKVLTHSLVPPNDGGIALGQAMAALYQFNK